MALREELELGGIDDAIAEVGRLGDALTTVASDFSESLSAAIAPVQSITVEDVDASSVTSSVDAAVDAADTTITVTADVSAAEAAGADVAGSFDTAAESADSAAESVESVGSEASDAADAAGGLGEQIGQADLSAAALLTTVRVMGPAIAGAAAAFAGFAAIDAASDATAAAAAFQASQESAEGTAEAVDDVAEGADEAAEAAGGLSARLNDADLSAGGLLATVRAINPVVAGAVAAFAGLAAVGSQFDDASDQIIIATGAAGDALADLEASLNAVVEQAPVSLDLAADVIGTLNTLLGSTGDELEAVAVQIVEASRLLGEDAAQNASQFAQLLNQFALDAGAAPELIDELFVVTQRFGGSLSGVIATIREFGPLLSNAGFTVQETAVLFGQLSTAGIEVSRIGPALNAFFRNSAASGEDLREALGAVVDRIANAQSATEGLTIATEAFGAEGAQRFTTAIRTGAVNLDELTDALDGSAGAVADIAERTDDAAEDIRTAINQILTALAPVAREAFLILNDAVDALEPAIDSLVNVIAEITPALEPVVFLVGNFAEGTAVLVSGIGGVLDALGPVAPALAAIVAGLVAVRAGLLSISVTPVGALATGLVAATTALGIFSGGQDEAAVSTQEATDALIEQRQAFLDGTTAVEDYNEQFEQFILDSSQFAARDTVDELLRIGVSFGDLNDLLADTRDGFAEVTARAIEAGRVDIAGPLGVGASLTADEVRNLGDELDRLLATGELTVTQGEEFVSSLNAQQIELERSAERAVRARVASEELTEAQLEEIIATANLTDETGSWQEVLELVDETLADVDESTRGTVRTYDELTRQIALTDASAAALAEAFATGALGADDFDRAAQLLGVSVEQVGAFADSVAGQVQTFVDDSVAALPTLQSAFDDLEDSSDPQQLIDNLAEATGSIITFAVNLAAIEEAGFGEVADFLRQQGPEAAAGFAQSFRDASPEVQAALQEEVEANRRVLAQFAEDTRERGDEFIAASAELSTSASEAFEDDLDLASATQAAIDQATAVLDEDVRAPAVAREAGEEIGAAFAEGMVAGFGDTTIGDEILSALPPAGIGATGGSGPQAVSVGDINVGVEFTTQGGPLPSDAELVAAGEAVGAAITDQLLVEIAGF